MSLGSFASRLADSLADGGWHAKARPEQLPPPGNWNGWLFLAGRGAGKTRSGAEWVKDLAEANQAGRIALIAPTAADARDIMVEGESGILATASAWCRPEYEPSKRRLTWPNGAQASMFSAEEPERLRGPQFNAAWCDELAAWNNPTATWDQLMFGLRLGARPRWMVTTTPKPSRLLRELLAREGTDVAISRASTFANAANLAGAFLESIRVRYEGTRLGRQELNAELLEDVQGALWSRQMIDDAALKGAALPDMVRVVVAIDPSGTAGASDKGDAVGIVVAGKGVDGKAYVLADRTCKLSPDGWGRRAVEAYREFKADRIIAERNFGGAMVEHVIRTVDNSVSYREVTASRGKIARAEPVAALYEQNRVKHVHSFPELEDELCAMTSDGYVGDGSPDRADATIWALTELMIGHQQIEIGELNCVQVDAGRYAGRINFVTRGFDNPWGAW
ncbi:DNA-packaging protein [Bradyrhizobium sp. AUGA SZCCT0182]|uniref:DNA-packaging protein n=1 Tax=Bradyrhizobium sp. AUGA SZCCT0182 TaxID=2807667 RepID=UPI001BA64EED|nr:terminase family protein [Bradyrhizobium sp. AUGA SZCCT0182]MBR1237662.1 DNA-packaging protein [Bradyrhizobium sp. AUGA SZCCT0182]